MFAARISSRKTFHDELSSGAKAVVLKEAALKTGPQTPITWEHNIQLKPNWILTINCCFIRQTIYQMLHDFGHNV